MSGGREEKRKCGTVALVLTLLLIGCAPRHLAAPQSVKDALRHYAAAHCDFESVVEHSGLYHSGALATARYWFYRRLHTTGALVKWMRRDAFRSYGELDIPGKSGTQRLWWDDYHPPGMRQHLVLHTCLFAVKHLDLIDSVFEEDQRNLRVLFLQSTGYSSIGRQLKDLGLLVGNNGFRPAATNESVAWLRDVGNDTWKVQRLE